MSTPRAMLIRNVLFPTDFSSCAESAFTYADELASAYGATLHILHAVVWSDTAYLASDGYFFPESERTRMLNQAKASAEDSLAEEGRRAKTPTVRCDQQVGGSATQVILGYADDHDIDVIVLGTHGRRGLSRMMLGSTAETVVLHAHCPVVTVRHRDENDPIPSGRPRRILVPVDFSDHTSLLLRHACALAKDTGAHLDLLHVVSDIYMPTIYGIEPIHLQFEAIQDKSRHLLEDLASEFIGDAVPVECHTTTGDPNQRIVDVAHEREADLIMIATHGYTGLKRVMMGSVAKWVIRRAECPVFTVRSTGKSLLDNPVAQTATNLAAPL